MQIGYGILLEGEIFNFMRDVELFLKEKYGLKKGLRQSPHITVKPPFEAKEIEPYLHYLDELCKRTKEFKIQVSGFDSFGKKVIYLNVLPTQSLVQLHEKILIDLSAIFDYKAQPIEGENIIFHATLAYDDLDESAFDAVLADLQERFTPEFTFQVKKIGLFYKLDDDAGWVIVKKRTLSLK